MIQPSIDPRWGNEGRNAKANALLNTLIHATGADLSDKVWLDAGCGSGGIAGHLATQVKWVYCIDPERWAQWEALAQSHSNLKFLDGSFDSKTLPLGEAMVDVVVCNQVYEHVSNPQQLITNIYNVLKPGGICYFAGPNLLWPIEPHVFWPFLHWLPRTWAVKILKIFQPSAILDAYAKTSWWLKIEFQKNGFEYRNIIAERAIAGMPLLRPLKAILTIFANLFLPATPGFVFLLRKPL
ncbi:class I SAM-dependent methyltransferase [Comamonas sp.]|uniref:class I SAM-dependent methyltransferase n=1 Tax=Comamonas sp. TaxID=34028 RepID=UPI0028964102|nr:class I SAM-dependent methyltransferase [Comamonas sp.]